MDRIFVAPWKGKDWFPIYRYFAQMSRVPERKI